MGLFDWLKPKGRIYGPTPEGVYGQLPRGARWCGGADPLGYPDDFLPDPESYVFDIVEWTWEKHLSICVSNNISGEDAGFDLFLALSDGSNTDSVDIWDREVKRGPVRKDGHEWIIPRGHPTRVLAFVSRGEPTTRVLRNLEKCFGYQPLSNPALPEKTAIVCELLILRAVIRPDQGRFTARMKVVLSDRDGGPYGEFFLNVNSARKQIWVSEKSSEYRTAILSRISHAGAPA